MKKQSSDILINLYNVLRIEMDDSNRCIKYNENRIGEINCYLDEIRIKDDENYNIFSPRKIESEYKYQIEESLKEKKDCENKLQYYKKRSIELKDYIYQIERVLRLEEIKK